MSRCLALLTGAVVLQACIADPPCLGGPYRSTVQGTGSILSLSADDPYGEKLDDSVGPLVGTVTLNDVVYRIDCARTAENDEAVRCVSNGVQIHLPEKIAADVVTLNLTADLQTKAGDKAYTGAILVEDIWRSESRNEDCPTSSGASAYIPLRDT